MIYQFWAHLLKQLMMDLLRYLWIEGMKLCLKINVKDKGEI